VFPAMCPAVMHIIIACFIFILLKLNQLADLFQ
jgi:hypothetical protein